jgi:regulation of enolase protein 1 (concanavalin A-like superfamily)
VGESPIRSYGIAAMQEWASARYNRNMNLLTFPLPVARLVCFAAVITLFLSISPNARAQEGAWSVDDIGSASVAGSSQEESGVTTLRGAGADIWGAADGFHYRYRAVTGDGAVVARFTPGSGHAWAKVGLMIRENLSPGSRNVLVLATPGSHVGLQSRSAAGGATTFVDGGRTTLPVWLMLDRVGDTYRAYRSHDGDHWISLGTVAFDLPDTVQVGFAISSHSSSALYQATADNFMQIGEPDPVSPTNTGGTSSDAGGWAGGDIGPVGPAGSTEMAGGTFTMRAGGGDIWGGADAFRMQYQQWTGDGTIVARVGSLTNTDPWAKAGVMIRSAFDSTSAYAAMLLTAGNVCGFQTRATAGAATEFVGGPRVNPAHWVKLKRAGDLFTGYVSADGMHWTQVGSKTLALGDAVFIGLAASAHSSVGALTTAVFDGVELSSELPLPPPGVYAPQTWGGTTGSASEFGSLVTVSATGGDIWGASDSGLLAAREWTGDVTITAKLKRFDYAHHWTKAGLMIRASGAANAANAYVAVTGWHGQIFQSRTATGAQTTSPQQITGPYTREWFRLVRTGNVLSGYSSPDGVTWEPLGSATVPMSSTVQVGIAISSHHTGDMSVAEFVEVAVE